jgi:hypothetical protein
MVAPRPIKTTRAAWTRPDTLIPPLRRQRRIFESHALVFDSDALPGLVTVVADEAWDRASVKDDAVELCVRLGADGRGKLWYTMP